MSWWELFRQVSHEGGGSEPGNHRHDWVTAGSDKSPSSSSKQTVPNWSDNRDYLAARRYWHHSSNQS